MSSDFAAHPQDPNFELGMGYMLSKEPKNVAYVGCSVHFAGNLEGIVAICYTFDYKPGVIVVNRLGAIVDHKDIFTRKGYSVSETIKIVAIQ